MSGLSVGIDFGTTNTVIACARGQKVEAMTFAHRGAMSDIFRSALCFWNQKEDGIPVTYADAGNWAIEHYLTTPHAHRFIQSFKSYVASRSFEETRIFGARFLFEDLLGVFLRKLIEHTDGGLANITKTPVIAGRPVRFVGSDPDEGLALERLRTGYARAGILQPRFAYEPVGAAYFFAQRLKEDTTVLVADFGGGTSDFSVVRFKTGAKGLKSIPLGYSGIGIAGDRFDYRIIDHAISPLLGKGSAFVSFGKRLPMPNAYYIAFAQWHQLALLKSQSTVQELRKLATEAVDAEMIKRLITIIEDDLGFLLYQAVSDAKIRLSSERETELAFVHGDLSIREKITRSDFESWIAEDLSEIAAAVDQALTNSGVKADEIDRVFLTGGSSYVPAVYRIFEQRFGAKKLDSGDHLQSIAYGLALIGQDSHQERWLSN